MTLYVNSERETLIESRFVRKARALGWRTRKLNGLGNRSWPDQLVVTPGGVVAFIEFKKVGEEPTKVQWNVIRWLRSAGQHAEWFDDDVQALRWVESLKRS